MSWAYNGGTERDRTSVEALIHACENGVTWVDTAPTYGKGHSEELVGQAAQRLGAARPLIFTKCGRRWPSPGAKPYSDLRPEALEADCDASLRRLGVEAIDMLQIHWPEDPERTPLEESWAAMRRLVDKGKIRAAGICNANAQQLERCERIGRVDSLQIPFSLVVRDAAGGLLQTAAKHRTAVLAYSPMVIGLLTDSFKPESIESLHPEDWRRRHPEYQQPRLARNLALRERIREISKRRATSVEAMAIAWVLSWPEITGAIVGASRASQVDAWLHAKDVVLTDQELDQIAEAIEDSDAGSGPARPQASTTTT